MNQEPLFASAHAALTFALNYSVQQYDRSLMARLASPSSGAGKGLVGLDGAGQAGMIRAQLESCGRQVEAVMVARIAPRRTPCSCRAPCCSGHTPNKDWTNAVAWLVDDVRNTALAGTTADRRVRKECVVRFFESKGKKKTLEQIADDCGINRKTASAYATRVADYLKGLEHKAGGAVEDMFKQIGVL